MSTTEVIPRRRTVRRVCAVAVVLAVTLGLGLGCVGEISAQSPADPGGDAHAESSRRITITNMTADTLTLIDIFGDRKFEGAPKVGDSITPGHSQAFEMSYLYAKTNVSAAVYQLTLPDGRPDTGASVDMTVASNGVWSPKVSSSCKIGSSQDGLQCSAGGDQVVFSGKPGSVFTLDGSQPNQTAAVVLQQLCATDVGAKCSFAPISETKRLSPATLVGRPVANATSSQQTKSVTGSDTVESSDSLGGSVSLTVPIGPVQAAVQASYNHTWIKSHTFQETQSLIIPARNWGWIEAKVPFYQHTGTFTVNFGNTTWRITNVTINSPDTKDSAVWVLRERPMTQQEYDDLTDRDWDGSPIRQSVVTVLPGN